jgi:hypothetical protein
VIWGFRCKVDEIFALLGCYAPCSGNSLPTLRDNLPVSSPSHCINSIGWQCAYWEPITAHTFPFINHVPKCDQFSSWMSWPMKIVLIGCPKVLVRKYRYTLHNMPEECRSQCFISLHALSRRHQITGMFTGHCRIVGPQYQTRFMSSFWHVEFGGGC